MNKNIVFQIYVIASSWVLHTNFFLNEKITNRLIVLYCLRSRRTDQDCYCYCLYFSFTNFLGVKNDVRIYKFPLNLFNFNALVLYTWSFNIYFLDRYSQIRSLIYFLALWFYFLIFMPLFSFPVFGDFIHYCYSYSI